MADNLQKHANLFSCALTGEQHIMGIFLNTFLMDANPMLQLVLLVG